MASYFLAAAAIKGGEISVTGIGKNSIQGDIQFADALENGCWNWMGGWLRYSRCVLKGIDMDYNHIPDAAMTIATTALFAKGTTAIRKRLQLARSSNRRSSHGNRIHAAVLRCEEAEDYIIC